MFQDSTTVDTRAVITAQATTACLPGKRFDDALAQISAGIGEPLLGCLGVCHVQLCPQNYGILNIEDAIRWRQTYANTQLRLHANVRVTHEVRRSALADVNSNTLPWFQKLAEVSNALGSPAYTLHAGERASGATLPQLQRQLHTLCDLFGIPVGVEALYPSGKGKWLLDTWDDHRWLLDSGCYYAIDLSHLNIVRRKSRYLDIGLVKDLLCSPNALEIHISDNDGFRDSHLPLTEPPWWWRLLNDATRAGISAVVFSEGMQRRNRPMRPPAALASA